MELINNRYRISESASAGFYARDLFDNERKFIRVVDEENADDGLRELFSREFPLYANIFSPHVVRCLDCGAVKSVDGRKSDLPQFYLISEYLDVETLDTYLPGGFSEAEAIKLFVDACKAVRYLHQRGIYAGDLCFKTVLVKRGESGCSLVINNPLELRLWRFIHGPDHYFRPQEAEYDGPSGFADDIYALGVLLFCLASAPLAGGKDFEADYRAYAKTRGGEFSKKIISLVDSMICPTDARLKTADEAVSALNAAFGTSFKAFDVSELGRINTDIPLVGREGEFKTVASLFGELNSNSFGWRYVHVHGGAGVGKTAFLKSLGTRLRLEGAGVYSAFGRRGGDVIKELIRQLIGDYPEESSGAGFVRQMAALAAGGAPGGAAETFGKSSVLKFMYDCVKDKPVMFIIDALSYSDADAFDALEKLAHINRRLMLVFSTDSSHSNEPCERFCANVREETVDILLRELNEYETEVYCRRKLSVAHPIPKFGGRVYKASRGNPMFIDEILKALHLSGILGVDEASGRWDIPERYTAGGYMDIPMPVSIHAAAEQQAMRLGMTCRLMLSALSVFNIPVYLRDIVKCTGIKTDYTARMLDECTLIGAVQTLTVKSGVKYTFSNNILREYFYGSMTDEGRKELHQLASEALTGDFDGHNIDNKSIIFDEIIFQLENAGRRDDTLREFILANAQKHVGMADYERAIEYYEKVLLLFGDTPEIYLDIAKVYKFHGEAAKSREFFERAVKLLDSCDDPKHKARLLCDCLNEFETSALGGALALFEEHPELKEECPDSYIYALREQAYREKGGFEKQYAMFETAYRLSRQGSLERARLLMAWGVVCFGAGRAGEAIGLWIETKQILDREGPPYTLAVVTYNLGEACLAVNNVATAKATLKDGIELAKAHRYVHLQEIMQEHLLEAHLREMELDEAVPLAADTAGLEDVYGQSTRRQEFIPYLLTDKYRDAFEIAKALDSHEGKLGVTDFFMNLKAEAQYWSYRARFAVYMGDDEAAGRFLGREERELESGDIPDFIPYMHRPFYEAALAAGGGADNRPGLVASAYARMKDIAESSPDTPAMDNLMCDFLLLLYKCGVTEHIGGALAGELKRLAAKRKAPAVAAKYGLLLSLTQSGAERAETLARARREAKSAGQPLTLAGIETALGEHYAGSDRYVSLYYFADACRTVQRLLRDVPEQFHETFVRRHGLLAPFGRVLSAGAGGEARGSLSVLETVRKRGLFDDILADGRMMEAVRGAHFSRLPEGCRSAEGAVSMMGGDFGRNLTLMAKYLAACAHAARCEILTCDGREGFSVIASDDGSLELKSDRQILRRVKRLGSGVLSAGGDSAFKAFMCVPIEGEGGSAGYVYLFSDSVLHNINEDTLAECERFSRLIRVNIEQHLIKTDSSVDKLTGALNRKALDAEFDRRIKSAADAGGKFSIIMIDLDKFKEVNDAYGHQTGDDVLRGVGGVFRDNLRKSEAFGRYGGEEFVVILDGADAETALTVAEKLRAALDAAKLLGSKRPVTASMGIATFGAHDTTRAGLIDKADKALYVCKESGRNQCRVYIPEYTEKTKSVSASGGIITGDSIKDGGRMRAILDIIELIALPAPEGEKIGVMLSKLIEMTEAEDGRFFGVSGGETVSETAAPYLRGGQGGPAAGGCLADDILAGVIADVIAIKESFFGIVDNQAVICAPVVKEGEVTGVFYLSAPAEKKEYSEEDVGFVGYLSRFALAV